MYVIDKPSPISVFTCKRQDSSNGKSRGQSLKEFTEEPSSVLNNIRGGLCGIIIIVLQHCHNNGGLKGLVQYTYNA